MMGVSEVMVERMKVHTGRGTNVASDGLANSRSCNVSVRRLLIIYCILITFIYRNKICCTI